MTNKEKQVKLDNEKWLESEKVGYDKAGEMDWCYYCNHQFSDLTNNKFKCMYDGDSYTPCATAYNRMKRVNKE